MFNINGFATIYNMKKDEKSDKIYFSTLFNSNKRTDKDGQIYYEKQYWNAKFVGKAKDFIEAELAKGTVFEAARVKIDNGIIEYRDYLDRKTSEKKKAYMITVFDFAIEKLSDKPQEYRGQARATAAPHEPQEFPDYPDYSDYPDIDLSEGEMF